MTGKCTRYADDFIVEILSRLPSECAYLDYKEISYLKDHYHDLEAVFTKGVNSDRIGRVGGIE